MFPFGVLAMVFISLAEFIYAIKRDKHGDISARMNTVGNLSAIFGIGLFLIQILHMTLIRQ